MKLEVGMYVRTKEGNIEKICAIENEHIYTNEDYLSWYPSSNAISKASYNIIDLIEVGDYVNGFRVEKSKYGELYTSYTYMGGDIGLQEETYTTFLKDYEEDYIYSIVTKEQFEAIKYEIK